MGALRLGRDRGAKHVQQALARGASILIMSEESGSVVESELILDFAEFDPNRVLHPLDEIRKYNAHRFEMEQLTAIVYEDFERQISVGYRDVREDEFWVRGNLPDAPMLPSMFLCEAAAQLCCFHVQRGKLTNTDLLGFAAMDEVEFGSPVLPGQRVIVVGRAVRIRAGVMVSWRFQAFVDRTRVLQGTLKGVPLKTEWLRSRL